MGDGLDTKDLLVGVVSASFFDFFNAKPVIGRFFTTHEDTLPVGAPVAVLTYEYWQARYGGRRDVIGRSIRADETTYHVIGVAPPGLEGITDGLTPIALVPMTGLVAMDLGDIYTRKQLCPGMEVLARVRAGVRAKDLDAGDLTACVRIRNWNVQRARFPAVEDTSVAHPRALAAPVILADGPFPRVGTSVARWISALALLVLLIACANAAQLLLVRALRQRRETAVRRAIGETRARLVQRLFSETLISSRCSARSSRFDRRGPRRRTSAKNPRQAGRNVA